MKMKLKMKLKMKKQKGVPSRVWCQQDILPPSEFEQNSLQLIARLRMVQGSTKATDQQPAYDLELETA